MARTGWLGPYLSPQTLLDPQLLSAVDELSPLFGEADAAGGIVDEDGAGWSLLNQITLGVVLAASLATTARASVVSQWQEEIVPQATVVGLDELYQLDAPLVRRVVSLPADPDTPEISPHLDELYEYVVAPQRSRVVVADAPADELIVAQPSFGLDEVYWQTLDAIASKIRGEVVYDTPELVPLAATISVDELYWQAPDPVLTKARADLVVSDEVIVPQPVAFGLDEVYWLGSPGIVTVVRAPVIAFDTPEIVPQPPPFPAWQDTWEPAFVRPAVRWVDVSQTQEEVVPTLALQEYWPPAELLVRAKPVITFPPDPQEPVIVPFIVGVLPQPGINSIAFDALITTVAFDTLTTAATSDSLATNGASDPLITSAASDSLTTTSAFDG